MVFPREGSMGMKSPNTPTDWLRVCHGPIEVGVSRDFGEMEGGRDAILTVWSRCAGVVLDPDGTLCERLG